MILLGKRWILIALKAPKDFFWSVPGTLLQNAGFQIELR